MSIRFHGSRSPGIVVAAGLATLTLLLVTGGITPPAAPDAGPERERRAHGRARLSGRERRRRCAASCACGGGSCRRMCDGAERSGGPRAQKSSVRPMRARWRPDLASLSLPSSTSPGGPYVHALPAAQWPCGRRRPGGRPHAGRRTRSALHCIGSFRAGSTASAGEAMTGPDTHPRPRSFDPRCSLRGRARGAAIDASPTSSARSTRNARRLGRPTARPGQATARRSSCRPTTARGSTPPSTAGIGVLDPPQFSFDALGGASHRAAYVPRPASERGDLGRATARPAQLGWHPNVRQARARGLRRQDRQEERS